MVFFLDGCLVASFPVCAFGSGVERWVDWDGEQLFLPSIFFQSCFGVFYHVT